MSGNMEADGTEFRLFRLVVLTWMWESVISKTNTGIACPFTFRNDRLASMSSGVSSSRNADSELSADALAKLSEYASSALPTSCQKLRAATGTKLPPQPPSRAASPLTDQKTTKYFKGCRSTNRKMMDVKKCNQEWMKEWKHDFPAGSSRKTL